MAAPQWRSVFWAGINAAVLATLVQMALWWIFGESVIATLLRDARLTAAVVSSEILASAPDFDWGVMLIATIIHFALSLAYSALLCPLVRGLKFGAAVLAGALFGAVLYLVNLYGFTVVFPWFAQTRGAITIAAHLAFGITLAASYKILSKPREPT